MIRVVPANTKDATRINVGISHLQFHGTLLSLRMDTIQPAPDIPAEMSLHERLPSTNVHEKEIISIVALLDVDDDTMLDMMGDVDLPQHHIIHCRKNVKQMLQAIC